MPKLKIDEDLDIVSFNAEELNALDAYFKGTNAETAYARTVLRFTYQ